MSRASSDAPVIRARNSQLRLLRECGFAYAESYVHDNPGLPSPSLRRGQNVHQAVAELLRRYVAGDPIDIHAIAYETVRGGEAEYADALGLLTSIQEALGVDFDVDPKRVFLLEEQLEMPVELSDGSEAVFFGTPDLVERRPGKTCLVTDWKTHHRPETQEVFDVDRQIPRYALLVHHHYSGFERFVLRKRFVRYQNAVLEREVTAEQLEQVEYELVTEIEAAIDAEAEEEFEATAGSWCGLCEHHAACPRIQSYRDYLEDGDWVSIPDDERASELAQTAIALHAASNRIKDQVKPYLSRHPQGAVAVSGGTYGYGPVTHRDLPVERAREVFEDEGLELPDDMLRVDLKAFDRLCNHKLPEGVAKRLRDSVETSQSSRCQFRRGEPALAKPEKKSDPPDPNEDDTSRVHEQEELL